MEVLIGLGIVLIIVIIFGAISGGENFGDTVRKGCGCLIWLFIVGGVLIYFGDKNGWFEDSTPAPQHRISAPKQSTGSAYFIVKENCETYAKPNKASVVSGYFTKGRELYVENPNKYNYFYEIPMNDGTNSYILKGKLRRK